ncbi:TlpA family protein disulfide reductase [Flavobacterium sp.]|uniref:TlpA family protein disulfide reductase n=1 Tax=Flavobacterium sp. TaxID=239 RepID=UPI003D1207A4
MKQIYLYIVTLLIALTGFSQDQEQPKSNSFADALRSNLGKYNTKVNQAFEKNNIELTQVLFDSLVDYHLAGTKFEDYTLKTFERKKLQLSAIQKPIFILTYASWCVPSKGEFQALNKLAQKHAKEVQFILLFWDKRKNIKKIANKFNHNIEVCYANESYQNDAPIVAHLKHSLGFPTSFFLDENLNVVKIRRGGAHPKLNSSYNTALTMNYNTFREGLNTILINKNLGNDQLSDSN